MNHKAILNSNSSEVRRVSNYTKIDLEMKTVDLPTGYQWKLLLENVKHIKKVNLATRFGLSTGARFGTILSIKPKDIDIVNRTVHLIDHKNSTTFVSYLHEKYFPDFDFLKDLKQNMLMMLLMYV